MEMLVDAYSRYVFQPSDVKMVFVRASDDLLYIKLAEDLERFDFGWSRYALGGVDVYGVAGTHMTLFKDQRTLSQVGALLTRLLDTLT